MLAFSFCWIADGVHTLLYGDRWPCFVYNIPVDFLGNFLLFQVSVSYRHSLLFPWGISTKGNLGRHHGSEKQLFWGVFYIILIKKSEHRLLSPLPVRCSQDHVFMFVRTGVKVQPMGKWCSWGCSKALHFPIFLEEHVQSLPGTVIAWCSGWELQAPQEQGHLHLRLKDWAIELSRCLQDSALRVNLTLLCSLLSSLKGKTGMCCTRILNETKLMFTESTTATVWQLN